MSYDLERSTIREKDRRKMSLLASKEAHILKKIKKHIPKKIYPLWQKHFVRGTFRITKPGRYVLQENIVFGPNPNHDFRPTPNDRRYRSQAYSLGFFAAITVECDGVEIDLNGYTLEQDARCAWMQRFYANIETASSPFIAGQGPGNFGDTIKSPSYIYIHGGTLGRSSHHGIHGNGNTYVWIEKVKMVDYEFIGSAINGGHCIVHKNCKIEHNFKDLKVLASWSAALFAQQFADALLQPLSGTDSVEVTAFRSLRNRMQLSINQTKRELFEGRKVSNALFRNDRLVGDGNVYGILSNPLGVAIHDFANKKNMKDRKGASYFYVRNCDIRDLEGDVDEVLSFVDRDKKAQKGPSGDLLKLSDCMGEDGRYVGNVLSDLIMGMAKLKKVVPQAKVGTLNISDEVLAWAEGRMSYVQLKNRGYTFITRQDSMGHAGKGVLGIRIDGTKNVLLSHNTIHNIKNVGRLASEVHRATDSRYLGTFASGIHVAFGKNVWIKNTLISDIRSYNGEATGIKGRGQSILYVLKSMVRGIRSGGKGKDGVWIGRGFNQEEVVYTGIRPNDYPSSKGLCWDKSSRLRGEDLKISGLKGPQVFYIAVVE